jgi:signal transduction histidine kinase
MDAMKAVEISKRSLLIRVRRESRRGINEAWVSVQDSGTGFALEDTDSLFKAFYTTKPQGLGMGLSISRSIVEAHGGRLWAERNDGDGATFTFNLPGAGRPEP